MYFAFRYDLDAGNTSAHPIRRGLDRCPHRPKLGQSSLDGGDACSISSGQQALTSSHGVPYALSPYASVFLLLSGKG